MLDGCPQLSANLSSTFQRLFKEKDRIREKLKDTQMLKKDTELRSARVNPTSCGVDGSYAIEKLLATDMIAFAAVAVEGLTPPSDKRYWPKPHHFSKVLTADHSDATTVVARAAMICMELELASKAPHDVIYLDNSMTTPFIYLNQALNRIGEVSRNLSELFNERLRSGLAAYKEILCSQRTDKIFAGLPKYTTRKEITKDILGLPEYEDRGFYPSYSKRGNFVVLFT